MPDLSFHIEKTLPVYTLDAPIPLSVILTNNSSAPLNVLSWGTPLEGIFTQDIFHVSKNGKTISYTGHMIKRGTPKDSDYRSIAPAKGLAVTIDLSKGYAIHSPGAYNVKIKPSYISTRDQTAKNHLLQAESNTIVIYITD